MRISEKKLTGRTQSIMEIVKVRRLKAIVASIGVVAVTIGIIAGVAVYSPAVEGNTPTPTITTTSTPPTVRVDPKFATVQAFIAGAKQAGWSQDQLAVEFVNPSADHSTAGNLSFLASGARSTSELLGWLTGDSRTAVGTRALIVEYTGATEAELSNPDYWVVAQSKESFRYTEMTLWKNGSIHTQADRAGNAGDIFFAFVPPRNQGRVVYVRGGCANPTLEIPTPNQPTKPEPTTRPEPTKPEPTTRPEPTKPEPTTRPTTTLKAKDPTKDVLANPLVADWKKNAGELLQILWDLEAPNGYQPAPREEAKAKAEAIQKANKELEQKHSEAVTQAPVVDGNQGHVAVERPSDHNWSPFG